MGLFNWFSWQLERRTLKQQIDRLVADRNQVAQEAAELRTRLAKTGMLLDEAQSGAKFATEQQDKLRTQLELAQSATAYWERVAKDQQKRIAELRRPASELTCAPETAEPAESELERKAWELWLRGDDSIECVWRKAELWLRTRESKRNGQERLTNEK